MIGIIVLNKAKKLSVEVKNAPWNSPLLNGDWLRILKNDIGKTVIEKDRVRFKLIIHTKKGYFAEIIKKQQLK